MGLDWGSIRSETRTCSAPALSNGLVKFRPYSRRRMRQLFKAWAAKNKLVLLVVVVGVTVLLVVETLLLQASVEPTAQRWYLTGALHVGIVGIFAGMIGVLFHVHTVEAMHQLRGAWGEEFTRDELKRARRKGLIWGWVDSITLAHGDIDHLVITKAGGLVAIDSKWRSALEMDDRERLRRDAERMRIRAAGIVRTLLKNERGDHRARGPAHDVAPLVVVWGPAQHSVPPGANIAGTSFVKGQNLVAWLRERSCEPISREGARELEKALKKFRADTWEHATASERSRA
jgi:hypothetical protein